MPKIYDMGPTALLPPTPRRKACWGFFRPKNPTASAGFEPANLGTKGQHATPRPPKPFSIIHNHLIYQSFAVNEADKASLNKRKQVVLGVSQTTIYEFDIQVTVHRDKFL